MEWAVSGLFLLWAYFELLAGSAGQLLRLLLVPDIFMLGYLAGNKWGAWIYNLGHSLILPSLLFVMGWWRSELQVQIAVIWLIHIAMDRALGYGLKTEAGFKHTHLGDIG